jgi:hypothetical protein
MHPKILYMGCVLKGCTMPFDFRGGTVFPAFRQYLQCTKEEESQKRDALVSQLKSIDDYLKTQASCSRQGQVTATGWKTMMEACSQDGPLFGGKAMNATDAAVAPKLYHIMVALDHFKVEILSNLMSAGSHVASGNILTRF